MFQRQGNDAIYPYKIQRLALLLIISGFVLCVGNDTRTDSPWQWFGFVIFLSGIGCVFLAKFVELRRIHRIQKGLDPHPNYVCSRCRQLEAENVVYSNAIKPTRPGSALTQQRRR